MRESVREREGAGGREEEVWERRWRREEGEAEAEEEEEEEEEEEVSILGRLEEGIGMFGGEEAGRILSGEEGTQPGVQRRGRESPLSTGKTGRSGKK